GSAERRLPVEAPARGGGFRDPGDVDAPLGVDGNPVGGVMTVRAVLVCPEQSQVMIEFREDDIACSRRGVSFEVSLRGAGDDDVPASVHGDGQPLVLIASPVRTAQGYRRQGLEIVT